MAFPEYDAAELAEFVGRPKTSIAKHTEVAHAQATLLFKLATCRREMPTDEDEVLLVKYALMAMADTLSLRSKFAGVQANPFSSETIGSYSYAKAATQVRAGQPTDVTWFDLAVEKLGECEVSSVGSGSIHVFERPQDTVRVDGIDTFVGPELERHHEWMQMDPA